ncbi:hypothetical protein Golob_004462, partial [Gossypium lobatum]|nr:hypothetical protein [Gossypium lobatum]
IDTDFTLSLRSPALSDSNSNIWSSVNRIRKWLKVSVSEIKALCELFKRISNAIIDDGLINKGCATINFPRVFHEYSNQYKLNIVSLLEPRVSGFKADAISAKLGLEKSPRVEAIGFSGGICTNRQKRKTLWRDLSLSIPFGQSPWLAIADFDAILFSEEKKARFVKGRRCPFFGDFKDKAQLQDLGFWGPPFTWHQ